MADRVTNEHLRARVDIINSILGKNKVPYEENPDGVWIANIGTYCLDYAYGGVALDRICTDGGGVDNILDRGTKRDLLDRMYAFSKGLQVGISTRRGEA